MKLLIGFGLAKQETDARRLLAEYPDWPVERIIKECRRKRKRKDHLELAKERLKRVW